LIHFLGGGYKNALFFIFYAKTAFLVIIFLQNEKL